MATDSYVFVGSAEAEMKMTDSITGEALGEAVDQRVGGMGIKSAASFQWVMLRTQWSTGHRKYRTEFCNCKENLHRASRDSGQTGKEIPKIPRGFIIKISSMQNLIATTLAISAERVEGRVAAEAVR